MRIFSILQLCICFTVILWNLSQPFMGDFFAYKSQKLLYEYVIKNKKFFDQLPSETQKTIISHYHSLNEKNQISFTQKIVKAIRLLVLELPAFERAWIFFSVILSILMLKGSAELRVVVWILPCLAVCYSLDNYWYGLPRERALESQIYPEERYLIDKYSKGFLNKSILEQKDLLSKAWNLYLIHEWAKETPSQNPEIFSQQLQYGEFAFQLARLEARIKEPNDHKNSQEPLSILGVYTLWNVLFALSYTTKKLKNSSEGIYS